MELDVLVFSYGNRPLLEHVAWTAGTDTARLTLLPPVLVDVKVTVNAGTVGDGWDVSITGICDALAPDSPTKQATRSPWSTRRSGS